MKLNPNWNPCDGAEIVGSCPPTKDPLFWRSKEDYERYMSDIFFSGQAFSKLTPDGYEHVSLDKVYIKLEAKGVPND